MCCRAATLRLGILYSPQIHTIVLFPSFPHHSLSFRQIMADNLMRLKGSNIIALAVVGFGHLDGIEKILEAEGWKPVRG